MNDLLDRVLDEYGLLICGWSAEWDFALRAAIERCNTQRFGTYWASRGNLGGEAQKLVALRRGTIIQIADADSFFRDLADKVAALEDLALADPVSAQVAIARMKRYLAAPEQRINLHDLVRAETERVFGEAKSERFSVNDNDLTPESVLRRLRAYEAEMQTLMAIVACGGYWATEEAQFRSIGAAVKRLGDDATPRSGFPVWVSLKKYPALLALYVAGIAAVSNRNYRLLQHLFALRLRTDLQHQPEQSVTEVLTTHETIEHRQQKVLLPGREQQSTPLNNHVFEALRSPLVEYTPDENSYDQAFDTFEYLLGLAHCDATTSDEGLKAAGTPDWYIWGPIGRFAWNHHHSEDHIQKRMHFESGGPCPGMVDGLIQAGMFRSHERLRLVKQGFDVFIAKVRPGIRAW